MVAIHSFLILGAVAGIASAGKCKPESSASSFVSGTSSTGLTETASVDSTTTLSSTILIESATTSGDTTSEAEPTTTATGTTMETSLTEAFTETPSNAISTTTSESRITTFFTSIITDIAETTSVESATTTTAAAPAEVTCPSSTRQCIGTMTIRCDVALFGLTASVVVENVDHCAQLCDSDASCTGFTFNNNGNKCYLDLVGKQSLDYTGWVTGVKGICQNEDGRLIYFESLNIVFKGI